MRLQLKISERLDAKMKNDPALKDFIFDSLRRFNKKDWGMVRDSEKVMNEMAIRTGRDVIGVYRQDKTFQRIVIRITSHRAFVDVFLFEELNDGSQQFVLYGSDGKPLAN